VNEVLNDAMKDKARRQGSPSPLSPEERGTDD
jgi:hypothetical protein